MKRPEPIELENNLGPDVNGKVQRVPWLAYDKDEMDLYISKKDAEISELKENYRNLRRNLFKAGAKWAKQEKMVNNKYESAKRYIAGCRKWRDEHPRNIRKHLRIPFYPIMGCRIYCEGAVC